jgi:hypothetical protein
MFDYAYKSTGYAMNHLTQPLTFGGLSIAVAAMWEAMQRAQNSFLAALQPSSQCKLALHYNVKNSFNDWRYWQLITIPNLDVAAYARVPLSRQNHTGLKVTLPDKFRIDKLPCTYKVQKFTDLDIREFTDYKTYDPHSDMMLPMYQMLSRFWVTSIVGGRQPTPFLLTNKLGQESRNVYVPVYFPTASIAMAVLYQDRGAPSLTLFSPIQDPVVMGFLPNRHVIDNNMLYFMIPLGSHLFTQFTRLTTNDYFLKIHKPNSAAFATVQIADTDAVGDDDLDNLLGF